MLFFLAACHPLRAGDRNALDQAPLQILFDLYGVSVLGSRHKLITAGNRVSLQAAGGAARCVRPQRREDNLLLGYSLIMQKRIFAPHLWCPGR